MDGISLTSMNTKTPATRVAGNPVGIPDNLPVNEPPAMLGDGQCTKKE